MIISPSREKHIRKHFIELDIDELQPDYTLFCKLTSSEQYYLVENYNWDYGVEILHWIIDSEKCDKGTALMMFWNAAPEYYLRKTSETIDEYEREVFELLKKIVLKFKNKTFTTNKLKFDPCNQADTFEREKVNVEWGKLPEELFHTTKGIIPLSLSRIILRFAERQHKKRLRQREKKRLVRNKKK